MISRLLALLTIAAMLLHSVLGCCWHHAHDVTPSPENVTHHSEGCGHRHHAAAETGTSSESPGDDQHEACREPSCVYVAAKHFEMPPATTPDVAVTVEMSELIPAASGATILLSLAKTPPRPAAPELRALLQVWVI
jgi:hypothetical protein